MSFEEAEFIVKNNPEVREPDTIYLDAIITGREILEQELVRSLSSDKWSNDFWYGIVSGFPTCCIMFFCDVWYRDGELSIDMNAGTGGEYHHEGIYYIQCPDCIAKSVHQYQTLILPHPLH